MAAGSVRRAMVWPVWAAWVVGALNLFDGVFTLSFLQAGLCEEANPFMRALYGCSPWLFLAVKLGMVSAAVWLLAHWRMHPFARAALLLGTALYTVLAAFELHVLTLR